MKKKFKTTGIRKKVIPATAALGILFSMAPIAENKASAGVATVLDVTMTSLGIVKDIYEALGIEVGDPDLTDYTGPYAENISYRAPSFKSGEFNISMHHTKDDTNFTKTIKVLYPNGKSEIHKLRTGQQLKITEAGSIVDLNPDAESVSEHNLLYITQAQLDEGKTGVALNQAITIYVEKTSGQNGKIVDNFYKKRFGENSLDGFKGVGVDRFSYLTEEQKKVATLTSHPVGREVLSNYVTNDPKALADFNNRSTNVLANADQILETPLALPDVTLNAGKPYQIIPFKKGTNKVLVKTGSKYLSGKEGNALQYSDSIGDDEVFELVQIDQKSPDSKVQFRLNNKNGVSLAGNVSIRKIGNDEGLKSEIRFTGKNNNEIHNWLRNWYPGKENVKQKYNGIEIIHDEKDLTKRIAKDSSGNVIKNSWVNQGNVHYYAGNDGVFLKGWQEIEGKTYYFRADNSVLAKGGSSDALIDGKYYHFNDDGALQRSVWSGQYYSDDSGAFIKEGLREIDNKIYYFQNYETTTNQLRLEDQHIILHFSDKGALERATDLNGNVLTSPKTVTLDGKQVVFEKDGAIRKTGLTGKRMFSQPDGTEKDAIHYYSLKDGATYTGWKTIDSKKYHFKDGANYTFDGHQEIDGKSYYFNHDGEAQLTGLNKIDGKIYYYDDKGVMQTGWKEIDGKWYYFQNSGEAAIGKFTVWGYFAPKYGYFKYYAKTDGSIYQNVTVRLDTEDGPRDYVFDYNGHYKVKWDS